MWEYLPRRWNGEEAAKLYKGTLLKELKKAKGVKKRYLLFEDNDPTGYKSRKGIAAKAEAPSGCCTHHQGCKELLGFLRRPIERRGWSTSPDPISSKACFRPQALRAVCLCSRLSPLIQTSSPEVHAAWWCIHLSPVEVGINAVPMPAYSPDLNPLDFFLWDEVDRRMVANAPADVETVEAYKKRLRLTALRLPQRLVAKCVSSMPARMRAVVAAKGHSIKKD